MPGVLARYQRRTGRLAARVGVVVRELAGRAGVRVLSGLAVRMSHHTAIRMLHRLPVTAMPVPRVWGIDDFALRRRWRYATILIEAVTRRRVDVLPDRGADTLETWLGNHPGVEVVCRHESSS